ncbi:pirin family protein [Aridibaculum aurantiacum]|uniref:pirin family protein n=1 Tax=Aridibaculum aurantiacum TaxID=2810307 RepID=UPI001A95D7B8|nr:pirin family protein [Aridibaculum aurantiacum]
MKTVKANYKAVYEPIADLVTYRAMPTEHVPMNHLDPFIFLNHHGWQEYKPNNNGLPFGPHPHRGFETVTFIIEGDLTHKDSSGASSIIKEGGVQWMTAGSGLVHAEISSDEFKQKGGPLEILQLWVNLPAAHKMTAPKYTGLQQNEIPVATVDDGKVRAQVISGEFEGTKGAIEPLTDIHLTRIDFSEGGKLTLNIDAGKTVFLYVVRGVVKVNGEPTEKHHIVEFSHDGKVIELKATEDAMILFGHATPFHEPFVAYGPFVMNTQEEIMQAYEDYNQGKFGGGI